MTALHAPTKRASWHDAYDAQMALWRWYRTEMGARWLQRSYQENSSELSGETKEMLFDLYSGEYGRLLDSDPIYVSDEMCEVIDVARESFAPEPLLETDLITPRGFLYWAHPLVIPDRFDTPQHLRAVSWSRIFAMPTAEARDALRERIASGENIDEEEIIGPGGATVSGVAICLYSATRSYLEGEPPPSMPELVPMHLTPWYFGMSFDGNEWDEIGQPTAAEWWWRLVQTTFRLMLQRISVKHHERPHRAVRRAAAKLGLPDETEVVVVRLRREAGERHEPTGETANYSHRFIRSGHWRNQWYPSIRQHRQIWISPTVVGDPGLPLIVRPRRVFQWNR